MRDNGHNNDTRRDPSGRGFGNAERDLVALAIAAAAIIMFLGTGSSVLPQIVRSINGIGIGPNKVLVNALILNIALVIFGWRRYKQLVEEIAERRKAENHARALAETDSLTGCLNHRSLGPAIIDMLAKAESTGQAVCVLMIDLDNFKQVNDFNGHNTGDEILVLSARRLRETLPVGALLARLGGDEFAAVLPFDPRRAETMDELAVKLIDAISQPATVDGKQVAVTASIGLVRSDIDQAFNRAWDDPQAILHLADIAMYSVKKQGKNRHSWFEPPMREELRFRTEMEKAIRNGIENGEFVPYYERQVDVQTGELTGFEMLSRWNSPTLGLVSPDIFIPIAEEIGLISELSEAVIAQALEDARMWDSRLTLAVNISPIQLRDPWFAQKLLKLLVEANFPPERLEIEVTESCLHENVGTVRSLINSLQNQGIRVSLDDFGTGYSSLAQLRNLPFDRIKIDRSFIAGLKHNDNAATIVQAIALLGRGLGLPITAEGIETAEILERLQAYGEIRGQGYLYGKPAPADQVLRDLAPLGLLCEPCVAPACVAPAGDASASASFAASNLEHPHRRAGNG